MMKTAIGDASLVMEKGTRVADRHVAGTPPARGGIAAVARHRPPRHQRSRFSHEQEAGFPVP
ncbi:MAG TPA: hypothetical protein VK000_08055 [Luteimonas sp.]|nr:hypothetical protein [Luteimonas sp.]